MHAKSTGELISFGFSDCSVRSSVSANHWVQTKKRLHFLADLWSQFKFRSQRKSLQKTDPKSEITQMLWSVQCLWVVTPEFCKQILPEWIKSRNPSRQIPPSATMVSAELFSHGTGTLRCLQQEVATYRHWSVSLWRDPDDVSHCRILSPDKTEWRLI